METVMQILFMALVMAALTFVFAILAGIRKREIKRQTDEQTGGAICEASSGSVCVGDIKSVNNKYYQCVSESPGEWVAMGTAPEKRVRNAQIARAILYGCTSAEVQRNFDELSKARIYNITRNVCRKIPAKIEVTSHTTMTELRLYKDQFLPQIEEYLKFKAGGQWVAGRFDGRSHDSKYGGYVK